jgi:crossover junction endodeoxyribonuclease RuvC
MGWSAKQLAAVAARLASAQSGSSRSEARTMASTSSLPAGAVVLGIDPSLRGTGWGFVRADRPDAVFVAAGTVKCPPSWSRSRCLGEIAKILEAQVALHRPTVCVCEGLFFAQNLQTALIMGEARGAALGAVAQSGVPVFEIAPRRVKQAIVGFGGAQKLAVARMIQRLLRLETEPASDEADALAIALTFIHDASRPMARPPKRV